MGDQTRREDENLAATELDQGELEQVQGGGLRATTGNTSSLKLGGTLKVKVKASKIRTGGKELDFDGTDSVP